MCKMPHSMQLETGVVACYSRHCYCNIKFNLSFNVRSKTVVMILLRKCSVTFNFNSLHCQRVFDFIVMKSR